MRYADYEQNINDVLKSPTQKPSFFTNLSGKTKFLKHFFVTGNYLPEQKFGLLKAHPYGHCLGYVLARDYGEELTHLFMEFLSRLFKDGVSAADLYNYISQCFLANENFGKYVARTQSAELTKHFFDLLGQLHFGGVLGSTIFNLLDVTDDFGNHIGMFLQDKKSFRSFLDLLNKGMDDGTKPEAVFNLLAKTNALGMTVALCIAQDKDGETVRMFIKLLCRLRDNGIELARLQALICKCSYDSKLDDFQSFLFLTAEKYGGHTLHLLLYNDLAPARYVHKFHDARELICNYILSVKDDAERKKFVTHALNQTTLVGKVMRVDSSLTERLIREQQRLEVKERKVSGEVLRKENEELKRRVNEYERVSQLNANFGIFPATVEKVVEDKRPSNSYTGPR